MDCVLGCARILRSEERLSPLAELLASVGDGAWIEPPFYCDYGWNISLAPGAYLNFNCVVLDCAPVEIVVRDVPASVVVAGNPCRVIREL